MGGALSSVAESSKFNALVEPSPPSDFPWGCLLLCHALLCVLQEWMVTNTI